MLRDADLALYAAKGAGKDRYELFKPDMKVGLERPPASCRPTSRRAAQASSSARLPAGLRPARTPVVGVEALIRWDHPERGVLAPDNSFPSPRRAG